MDKEDKNNNYVPQNNNLSNNYIPQDDESQNNPYYNPYFQNTDLNNSPYFNDNNINFDLGNLNESIEGNPNVPDPTNVEINTNIESNTNVENSTSQIENANNYEDLYSPISNTQNNQVESSMPKQENINTQPSDNIDLFNLTEEPAGEKEPSTQINNTNKIINDNQKVSFETTINNDPLPQDNPTVVNPFIANTSININENTNTNTNFNTENNMNAQNSYNNQNELSNNSNPNTNYYGSDNDDSFRKAWMGKLYSKAQKRKFSIPAFFFGGLYFLFRKLYLIGFIILLITITLPTLAIVPMFSEKFDIAALLSSSSILSIVSLLLNILYGFLFYPLYKKHVENKLKKYKNEAQNPSQLIDIASHKGGTSILAVIVSWLGLGLLSGIMFSLLLAPIMNFNPQLPNNNNSNNLINNEVTEEPNVSYELFNFYNDYSIEYNSSKWFLNSADNSLVNGNYKLSYIQSLENLSTVGYDLTTENGRSSFFTFLYNQFSAQIDSNTTLELGSSNFSKINNIYFAYLDLVYATSIERCYFILIPEEDTFIELILSNADTVISDEIQEEVYDYISNLKTNNVESDSNNINENTITGNNIIDENVVDNSTSNNVSNNATQPSEITLY